MKEHPHNPITWAAINELFAPFHGSELYAIRADLFFHLVQAHTRPRHYQARNWLYPAEIARRMRREPLKQAARDTEFAFVSDYAAEPGFGSLRPLLATCEVPAVFIGNARVLHARRQELSLRRSLVIQSADCCPASRWSGLWLRSAHDWERLCEQAAPLLRPALNESRLVVRTLLARAYWYAELHAELLANSRIRAVITHNDFASLSHTAGLAARRAGVPDITLQHGFPSQEYFPTTASHYLVWGERFREAMLRGGSTASSLEIAGAPRLDALAQGSHQYAQPANALPRILFFSQTHTPIFTAEEHARIQDVLASIADDPRWELHIRLHPQESDALYRRDARFARAVIEPRTTPLKEAVLNCAAVVSTNSTAMLEAALLNRPVLQIALPGMEDRIGLLQFPAQIADAPRLRAALEEVLVSSHNAPALKAQNAFISSCVHDPGQGTQKVWECISRLAAPRRNIASAC